MATTGDLTNLSNDVYNASGAPAGWTRLDDFPGLAGFYGAVYRNANGETFAVMRGMELSLLDQAAVAQVELGIKPLAFNSAVDFYRDVTRSNRFGNTVTFVGHSLGGAMVDYIAAVAASEGTRVTGITFGAIGIGSILASEGRNGTNLNDRLTNYIHPLDIAKTVGTRVGTQVEVPYTRGWIDNLGALFGLTGLFGEATRQHAIQSYQQSFNAQGTLTLTSSHLLDMLAVTATSGNGEMTYTVNPDQSVTVVTTEFQSGGLIKSVQTSRILPNGNISSTTVDANNNVTATSTATVNQVDQSVTIVRKNFDVAGQVESEGTMRLDQNGRATLAVGGDGFNATVNNTITTIQPGAQANINGDGSYVLALANSTVQTTLFNSTLLTAPGGSTTLINLGSNNNLVLGTGTTVDNLGNNNTIIGPVPPNTTDSGTGNTNVDTTNLPPGVVLTLNTSTGVRASIDEEDQVLVADGGSEGGSFDNTAFGPGPDPLDSGDGGGGGGGGSDPDPMINGHAFLLSGDFEITGGDGGNSIEGGLNKNVIVVGGGNNAVNAAGTQNTVVAGGGNNLIGVGGGISTVSVGGGVNVVSDFSQAGFVVGQGNLFVNFGVGNHTIIAGSGAALNHQDFPGFIPDTGIPFANVIRGNGNFNADVQGLPSNLIYGGPNGNYIQGGLGDNTIYGGDSADQLIGGTSHSRFGGRSEIHGGGGDDVIEGGVGGEADLFGEAGNDILRGGSSRSILHGGAGNDTLRASSSYDSGLYGDAGDDLLTVGLTGGNVTLAGGAGNDTLIGTSSSFLQTVVFGRGYDHDNFSGVTSRAIISMNAGVLPEDVTLHTSSQGDLFLSINGTDDVLGVGGYFVQGTYTIRFSDGTSWNKADVQSRTPGLILSDTLGGQTVNGSPLSDTLSGSGGHDTLVGGGGGDTYLVDVGNGVTSIWDGPDGTNTLVFGAGITPDSVTFGRTAQQGIVINYGTQGDAVHVLHFDPFDPIRSLGIQAIQLFDGTVWETPTILSRTPGVVLSDTVGHTTLQGSSLNDTLSGAGGNDTLSGGAGNDTYLFDQGHGHVSVFDQDLSGGTELNTIQMAAGIAPADVTVDLSPDGALLLNVGGTTNQVSLTNYRERSFQSFQVSFADGTVWDRDALIAQIANFPIVADPGGSELTGSALSDTLIGLDGDDSLDGLGGADVMSGGGGNDVYYVEDPGDQVIELPGEGHDVVRSYIDYTLPDNVEDLQLSYSEFSGPIPIVGIGNSGNNDIRGNFQNNSLQGGAGDDTLFGGFTDGSFGPGNDDLSGGTGNDTYYVDGLTGNGVDTIHDTALPGGGNRLQLGPSVRPSDLTFSHNPGSLFVGIGTAGDGVVLDNFDPTNATGSMVVETISFTGGIEQTHGGFDVPLADFLRPAIEGTAGNDVLTGTAAVDIVRSGSGADVITGGQGNDVLIGGSGEDTYVFNLGDGSDLIDDLAQPGEANRVLFGAGIDPTSLRLEHSGQFNAGLLTIHVGTAGDALHFLNFEALSPTTPRAVETFEFTDGTTTTFDQLLVRGVEVRGTAGDDGELFGTFANDTLLGFAGRDSLNGDVGNDTLIGGAGNDFLSGGEGADTYLYAVGDGRDDIEDEEEFVLDQDGNSVLANNRILFGEGITLSDIDVTAADGRLFISVGTTGAGLNLGPFGDVQLGIQTLAFHDGLTLKLPDLTDALIFAEDDRVLTGGTGNSTVLGGNGSDILTGGDGSSVLIGWKGDDVLVGGTGPSTFYGGLGNDLLQGNTAADDTYVFNRGDGADTIQDTAGIDVGNRIQFGAGIALEDLVFSQDRAAKRLTISVGTSGLDVIQLENFTVSGADGSIVTQTLAFQDGSLVQLADLLATPGQVIGTSANDVLTGTSGNDTLTGGTGNDSLAGGAGDDTYIFNIGDGVDSIADTATSGEGNTIQFGPGITPEDLSLGLGSLLIRVGTNGDAVHLATFNLNDALGTHSIDRFRFSDGSSLSYAQLIARGFDLSGTSESDVINGTNVNDRMQGLLGDDSLFGGQGVDTLVGGLGNDTYSVDSLSDVVIELPNEGIDRVLSAVNYTLGSNVENLTLAGGSDINGSGNELNNILVGNRGNNILDGGVGVDTMSGGVGHDTYVIDDLGDAVTENADEGTDTVRSSLSYTLGENVENLRLVGSADLNGTGNVLDNVLVGNDGTNVLTGGTGNDRLHGAIGNDSLLGEQGDDTYRFDVGDGVDTIQDVATVGEGNRILFGTDITQADLTFTQDSAARTLTIQVGSSGADKLVLTNFDTTDINGSLVVETLAFADGSTVPLAEVLGGTGVITGTASNDSLMGTDGDDTINALDGDDTVAGLAGNDTLSGGTGNDSLDGGDGDDLLNGDNGNDVLNGGLGADRLSGGDGDDTLYIDGDDTSISGGAGADVATVVGVAGVTLDVATAGVETVIGNDGNDTFDGAAATVALSLDGGAGSDGLTGGSANDVLAGQAGNDTLTGGAGNDVLNGGVGVDVISGGDGDDTLYIDADDTSISGDAGADVATVVGGAGVTLDVATAGVETVIGNDGNDTFDGAAATVALSLDGGAGNDVLTGGSGNDVLVGGAGNDTLTGGAGNDVLHGGEGDDTYVFHLGDGVDTIYEDVGPGTGNTLVFGAGITAGDLSLGLGSLLIRVGTGGDAIHLENFNPTNVLGSQSIATFRFADNSTVTYDQLVARGFDLPGTTGDDTLIGTDADDRMTGGAGNDRLEGRAGSDRLDGGAGADTLIGGLGDDIYVIDQTGDVVTEQVNEGTDTVESALTYTLGSDVENLTLTGTGAITGTGNALDNFLTGNSSANTLTGEAGADTLQGGAGTDVLVGGTGHDVYRFTLGDGRDTVQDVATVGEGNRLEFGAGISRSDLSVTQDPTARTLTIQVGSSGTDQVVLTDFDPTGTNGSLVVETLAFADGTTAALQTFLNQAPTVANPLADQTVPEDAPLSRQVPVNTFADQDVGDTLVYSASLADGSALPSWLSFDATTRTFTGTPDDAQVGTLNLTVTATDSGGLSASSSFALTVQNVNEAPTVATPLANQTTLEDALFSFAVPATTFADPDAGDTLTYSATLTNGTVLPTWLSFNAATRTFSGTPVNSDVGDLAISVTATDAGGLSTTNTFTLTVQNVNDAPTVANLIADQQTTPGTAFSFVVAANTFADVDVGDTLTYNATLANGAPLPTWLTFNPATRTFSGTPGTGDAGVLTIQVTATDTGALSAGDLFDLTVNSQDQVLTGTAGNDTLTGGVGDDQLFGLAGNDTLTGNAGNDLLDGGAGSDTMRGNSGDDTYVVNATGDVVTELANEGTDTVQSSLTYTLGANLEHLTLTGTTAINGTGNTLDNSLTGNSANNTLTGGAGHDILNGGAGTDTLVGGLGNDTYVVEQTTDVVTELANEGTDSVQSAVTFTIGANVENLTLTGTANINGTGGSANNTLVGNSGNNVLDGVSGEDTITAGAGNDTLLGGSGHDVLNGEDGVDTLDGGAGDDQLLGGAGNDTMTGGSGADQFTGGTGNDTVTGNSGNDLYHFSRGDGQDTILDSDPFNGNQDRVVFGTTINPLDLVISRQVNDLRVAVHGTSDQVTIKDWYTSPTRNQIEQLQAGNGQDLLNTQVEQLIQTMASFSQQTGLTWDQAIDQRPQDVQAIVAASWQ